VPVEIRVPPLDPSAAPVVAVKEPDDAPLADVTVTDPDAAAPAPLLNKTDPPSKELLSPACNEISAPVRELWPL
jgi:hypothetical protein